MKTTTQIFLGLVFAFFPIYSRAQTGFQNWTTNYTDFDSCILQITRFDDAANVSAISFMECKYLNGHCMRQMEGTLEMLGIVANKTNSANYLGKYGTTNYTISNGKLIEIDTEINKNYSSNSNYEISQSSLQTIQSYVHHLGVLSIEPNTIKWTDRSFTANLFGTTNVVNGLLTLSNGLPNKLIVKDSAGEIVSEVRYNSTFDKVGQKYLNIPNNYDIYFHSTNKIRKMLNVEILNISPTDNDSIISEILNPSLYIDTNYVHSKLIYSNDIPYTVELTGELDPVVTESNIDELESTLHETTPVSILLVAMLITTSYFVYLLIRNKSKQQVKLRK